MTGWVKEHPERRARLMLVPGRAKSEHGRFCGVQVVDRDIEMHLLRDVLSRPLRRSEADDLLKPQRVAVLGTDEPGVLVVLLERPVEQGAVERGHDLRVGAVEDDDRETCDSHVRTVGVLPDNARSTACDGEVLEKSWPGCRIDTSAFVEMGMGSRPGCPVSRGA